MSRYAKNPMCADCGKPKGPKQLARLRCFRCQKVAERASKQDEHSAYIKRTYGIDGEFYRALMSFQGGKCAICMRATGRTKRLAVDHNHACPQGHPPNLGCPECVRGLLCATCNVFLGRMRDDPAVGERMARYLRVPPAQELRAGNAPPVLARRLRVEVPGDAARGSDGRGPDGDGVVAA